DQTVIKQSPKDCDTVRHAARRIELRQGILRIGSPVASRLRNFYEPGSQGERWMPGEVRDRELLVPQRWNDQYVDFLEDARHLQRDLSTKSVRLYEINRRQESRLSENVGPSVFHLHLQRPEFTSERQLFKRGCALRE